MDHSLALPEYLVDFDLCHSQAHADECMGALDGLRDAACDGVGRVVARDVRDVAVPPFRVEDGGLEACEACDWDVVHATIADYCGDLALGLSDFCYAKAAGAVLGAVGAHALHALPRRTCAVVASSGSLYGSGLGAAIDAHDVVIRANGAPANGSRYTADVGLDTPPDETSTMRGTSAEMQSLAAWRVAMGDG